MNTLVTTFDRRWFTSVLSQLWRTSTSASKVQHSTAPPELGTAYQKPFEVELLGEKRYSWCSCGYSNKQPFCDGSHKTKAPGMFPLRFVPEKDSTVVLCGCKRTNNPPYCDGTQDFCKDLTASATLHDDS